MRIYIKADNPACATAKAKAHAVAKAYGGQRKKPSRCGRVFDYNKYIRLVSS